MPIRNYTRKTDLDGIPGDPSKGDPTFLSGITTALPGRTWRTHAGTDVVVDIDGGDLTQQEDDDLTAAHTAWTPGSCRSYAATYEVETAGANRRLQKIEWFETDNGDGTYSNLAKDKVYTWLGAKIVSIVTTEYFTDGSVSGKPKTEAFYTTSDGKQVRKVTNG